MAKYVITVQQVIDVEAKNEEIALRITKDNPPRKDMFGTGPLGYYELNAHKSIKIISCIEKRRKKNASQ